MFLFNLILHPVESDSQKRIVRSYILLVVTLAASYIACSWFVMSLAYLCYGLLKLLNLFSRDEYNGGEHEMTKTSIIRSKKQKRESSFFVSVLPRLMML